MRVVRLVIAVLVLGGPLPAAAAAAKPVPWWNKAWRYRKIVQIKFPRQGNDLPVNFFAPTKLLGERALTGKAVIEIGGKANQPGREVVVTDESGKVMPARAYASGWGQKVTVLFRAEPKTAEYFIYYGNPKAKRRRMTWRRSAYPLMMVTVPVADGAAIKTPAAACKALLAAAKERGKIGTYSVNNPVNPFGLEAGKHYITLYSGLMFAPSTGAYDFSLDAGGIAHLYLNGALALTVRGGPEPVRDWKHAASVKLEQGVQNFTILHGERVGAQGIRVGWKAPGQRRIELMTGTAFARSNYAPAELVGFEELGKVATPFFAVKRSDKALKLPGGDTVVTLKLRNLTRGDGLTYKWTLGDKVLVEHSPQCFVKAGGDFKVVLEVFKGPKSLGTFTRTVNLRALRYVKADATSELLSCPAIVYQGEEAKVTFRVSNLSEEMVPLQYSQSTSGEKPITTAIELPAGASEPVDVPLQAPAGAKKSVQVTFRLSLMGYQLTEETVQVMRPGMHLAGLKTKLGRLVDRKGRRIVLITTLENEADYRRWAVLKWAAKQLRGGGKTVLLFGDRMLNVPDSTEGQGYVGRLKRLLAAQGRTLTFVRRSGNAIVPCIADIPAFATALKTHRPDLVIISPGSFDTQKGVARRQLARSLDVLIDIARSMDDPPRVALVTPPPLVSNPKLSGRMSDAVRTVARQHHVPVVDLHSLLSKGSGWQNAYKEGTEDAVFYLYPGLTAHRAIAEAIFEAVK